MLNTDKMPTSRPKNNPSDLKLYNTIKAEAKSRFTSWPSAYASGWLVQTYKKRFQKKYGDKKSPYRGEKQHKSRLSRWYKEEWINICKLPNIVPCGRSKSKSQRAYWKDFPYCRPRKRVAKDTPTTVSELSPSEIKKRCKSKKKNPKKRLNNE